MRAGEEFEKDTPVAVPADRYTRREALRWGSSAAVAAALTPTLLASGCAPAAARAAGEVDVAIVGGGPSGLYAAYRLLTGTAASGSPVARGSGPGGRPSVAVFEAADRLGGRIWSVVPPGAPHLIAEFGGMRFLKTQEIVPRLVRALRLRSVPFSHGDGRNLAYLRGVRFRQEQYADPAVVPYPLPASEAGRTPAQLMLRAIDAYVPRAATLSPAEWEQVKKTANCDGELLSDLHGVRVPTPSWSGFIDWQNLPYGNAFHAWQVHARSWQIIPYLRQPLDGTRLSICGDCWSPAQNWIESGLTTTEGLLQSTFRYRPPPWLPEGTGIST